MRLLRLCVGMIVVTGPVAGLGLSSPAAGQKPAAPRASAPEPARDQISKLRASFRRARSPARQVRVVQQAMRMGPEAVAALMETIEEEMRPEMDRYRRDFFVKAAGLSKQHLSKADPDEIARLRQTVLSLQRQPNFSKELIVQKGDPAMQRLEQIFSVSPAAVLAQSRDLPMDRRKLMVLGMLWQQCALYLYSLLPNDA